MLWNLTENIALFVENEIKELGKAHASYLEDTPDFLRHIEELNKNETLPDNVMLVVIYVVGLYDNIPPKEGVQCVEESLKKQPNTKVPSEFTSQLLEIILQYSVFEFDKKLYQQLKGSSMEEQSCTAVCKYFYGSKDRQTFS